MKRDNLIQKVGDPLQNKVLESLVNSFFEERTPDGWRSVPDGW